MNSNSKLPEIRKEAFVKAREKLSLSAKDLGGMACLSHHQISQMENGESSFFYGAQNKFTAAKKVAKLLNLSDEEAFNYGTQTPAKVIEVPELEEPAKKEEPKEVEPIKANAQEIPFAAASEVSKPASPKKLFLWLSVLAALVFSAINLRTLFFADKPEEIIAVKEEIIEPAPVVNPAEPGPIAPAAVAAVVVAPAVTDEASTACPVEESIISYKPDAPRKAADMVYVQVKSKQVICVGDASGKLQNKMVEPGVGASFYGKPPFKVLTAGLNQVDVFFQGLKVRLSNPNSKALILEASEVLAPAVDRTDSQLR
ncbi:MULTISPECIES: helix-turn-helix transcriptional regulator [unclassified Polynucleobacter]|uniref:helix-turn-helix domain-containing protein n=1 Tax=unclassified Polynucleobacter TaxID=2640945 RepID=UPI000BD2BAD8|nr:MULTISPECIES: helix-turn-helix transcriptional regulator [unclassified Polynucleobacter]OYY14427.1 MAG: hypothetical protein B7Y67_10755 [Polynucleobacter sp. 35-46-11]OZA76762.1 MAG: hypothetical protein B7X71_07215 [Polynucleobacter sp. 39-46-10]